MCNFLGSVSPQQKFEVMDKPCYSSVLFGKQRKIHPRGVRACWPKSREEKRERERKSERPCAQGRERAPPFGSSFYMFFLTPPPPLSLPYVNWASQECCLFYLRSSLRSSDLPLFYFRRLFPCLSFSHRHSGLLFPILPTYQKHGDDCMLCKYSQSQWVVHLKWVNFYDI